MANSIQNSLDVIFPIHFESIKGWVMEPVSNWSCQICFDPQSCKPVSNSKFVLKVGTRKGHFVVGMQGRTDSCWQTCNWKGCNGKRPKIDFDSSQWHPGLFVCFSDSELLFPKVVCHKISGIRAGSIIQEAKIFKTCGRSLKVKAIKIYFWLLQKWV